ncbi:glycoside hydrolase family 130 protein [Emticicia sp.]|uniref:glycoside hydrolase family 130 protein n=1 Tax=Emticicia sp. TaxID=1930953 RepID=UPI003753A9DA
MKKSLILLLLAFASCRNTTQQAWQLTEFVKQDSENPILSAVDTTTFNDPILQKTINWEAKDVYNPSAVVRDGKVYLLYRAEDTLKVVQGTSRLGLAVSEDGIHFKRQTKPVFFPANDFMKKYEYPGGCEDPRLVETEDGKYILTYTAYDGKTARLCIASSLNLQNWTKEGLAFKEPKNESLWSKSGAIICKKVGERFVATKINGKYWMYWGDTNLFLASSDNLTDWKILEDESGKPKPIVKPRDDNFDSWLVESGPAAFIRNDGIFLIYNSANKGFQNKSKDSRNAYRAGQLLFDKNDPSKIIDRSKTFFFEPDKPYELEGQVNHVVFVEGLVNFKNKWFLYYGTADSKIAVAVSKE